MLIQYTSSMAGTEMDEFSQTASDYPGRCNASLEIQFCSPLGVHSSSEEHGEKQIDWFLNIREIDSLSPGDKVE